MSRFVCQRLTWSDADGAARSISIVSEKDREKLYGGYVPEITYTADGKVRECKMGGGGEIGGFGHLVMHGAAPRGWANSKLDGRAIHCESLLDGPYHSIYSLLRSTGTPHGIVACTVDYFVRTGRNDLLGA